jgi:rhodanese-related sulfurtransferase
MSNQQRSHRVRRIAALVAVGTIGLAACGGEDEPTVAVAAPAVDTATQTATDSEVSAPPFGLVSPQTALELSVDDDVTVIDVRTPEEFAEGHIDGATMIDFYEATFADEIAALDPNRTYLLYCRSGNRSGQTAALMQQLGFEQVYDLDGGVVAFGGQGLPLVP